MSNSRGVAIKETITSVNSHVKSLCIYKIKESDKWQARVFLQGKYRKKSTGTDQKNEAKKIALHWYSSLLKLENLVGNIDKSKTERSKYNLISVAEKMLDKMYVLKENNERKEKQYREDKSKIKNHVYSFFKNDDIRGLKTKRFRDFKLYLEGKGLSGGTQKKYMSFLSRIQNYAIDEELIDNKVNQVSVDEGESKRTWFDIDDYNNLKKATKNEIESGTVVRGQKITQELLFMIHFNVGSFLRISDIKNLKHRNIKIVEEGNKRYLRITTDTSKTRNSAVVIISWLVDLYKKILKYYEENKINHDEEDYVFSPKLLNRRYALDTWRRQFNYILEKYRLKRTSIGDVRTLYSLRHTAISFRIMKGDCNLIVLANNCRTSIQVIQDYYARSMSSEMNVEQIQSFKVKLNKTVETDFDYLDEFNDGYNQGIEDGIQIGYSVKNESKN